MKPGYLSSHFSVLSISAIIILLPLLFLDTTLSMVNVWMVNETFTHGFLIFPITLWLIWQNRHRIALMQPSPEPKVLALFIPLLALWFLSHIVDIQTIQQLCLISMISILTWLMLGRKITLSILFPLAFLFFAVPLGQGLIPPMMELTTYFVVTLVRMVGVPIYQDGLYFILPSGSWNVVEECSGVRYLIASVALGTLYAYVSFHSQKKRLIFVFFAIVIPILANGLRAFGIVMIGHLSGMELATGVDHLVYGWFFFGIIIFLMFYIGSFWWDPVPEYLKNSQKNQVQITTASQRTLKWVALISLGLILGLQFFAYQIDSDQSQFTETPALNLPASLAGWQYDSSVESNWQPEFTNPDIVYTGVYKSEKGSVQLNIGHYFYQREGAEAITSLNRLTNPYDDDWKITRSSLFKAQGLSLNETEIRKANVKLLVWHWYRTGSLQSSDILLAKLFQAYNRIFSARSDASFITISTYLDNDVAVSRSRLSDFMAAMNDRVYPYLDDFHR